MSLTELTLSLNDSLEPYEIIRLIAQWPEQAGAYTVPFVLTGCGPIKPGSPSGGDNAESLEQIREPFGDTLARLPRILLDDSSSQLMSVGLEICLYPVRPIEKPMPVLWARTSFGVSISVKRTAFFGRHLLTRYLAKFGAHFSRRTKRAGKG
jgi:hypothetical protein